MANPFQDPTQRMRRFYDSVRTRYDLPQLPAEAPRNLRMAGAAPTSGIKVASGVAPAAETAAAAVTPAAKSPGFLSRAVGKIGGMANTAMRGLGTAAGGAATLHDAYRTADALEKGNNLQAGIRAAETGMSALSMVPGFGVPAAALRLASGATFGEDGWVNRRGSHFDPQNPNKSDADWAVLANAIDPTKGATLEDTQRAMREAAAQGKSIGEPRQGWQGLAAGVTKDLPEFLKKSSQYGGEQAPQAVAGARATEQPPEAPEVQNVPARAVGGQNDMRLRDPKTGHAVFTDGSTSDQDRISTVPGFFEGGENSAYARGERYVQSLRDMQNLRAQLMDQGKPTPGTAVIGPASGGNAALDLRRLAEEQRNTPSAVVDRVRRGEINDRVAASLLNSYDRAQERLMNERADRYKHDTALRAEQERAALRLASERNPRKKGSEDGEDGLGFKEQLALAKFQADMAKEQREQRNADREFARAEENDRYGRRSAQQRDFMDRVDREFTELDRDGKPIVNVARRNEFMRFADQAIADNMRRLEAIPSNSPQYDEAQTALRSLRENPYQAIDMRDYRDQAALQELDHIARSQGTYVHSGTADGKRIVGKRDSWLPFKENYVTRDGSEIPTYAVDYKDGGYFSRLWKPKRTDLRNVMEVRGRG